MMKKTSFTLIILLVALTAIPHQLVNSLKYSVCDSIKSKSEVKDVKVSDCDSTSEPCSFIRGFNKTIELDFVPNQKVEQVKVKVFGKLKELPVPFRINPDTACGNYGFDCPLEAGKAYKFKLSLPILRTYPKIPVDVFLRLLDEKDEILNCVEIPSRIQEPQKAD